MHARQRQVTSDERQIATLSCAVRRWLGLPRRLHECARGMRFGGDGRCNVNALPAPACVRTLTRPPMLVHDPLDQAQPQAAAVNLARRRIACRGRTARRCAADRAARCPAPLSAIVSRTSPRGPLARGHGQLDLRRRSPPYFSAFTIRFCSDRLTAAGSASTSGRAAGRSCVDRRVMLAQVRAGAPQRVLDDPADLRRPRHRASRGRSRSPRTP